MNFGTSPFPRPFAAKKLAASALGFCLLVVGIAGSASLVRFAKKAAVTETFGFPAAYSAARLVILRDRSGNLQDWNWFRAQTQRFGFKATDVFYGNPPSAALVMLPIASLSPSKARVVWTWFSLGLWATGIALLGSRLFVDGTSSRYVAIPALLCLGTLYAPLRANVEEGQTYVFAFALQSACCWFWMMRRPAAAGVFGGALLGLKGYGLPFIIFAALRRDWAFLRGAFTSFGLLAIIAAWALGTRQWIYFFLTYRGASFSGIPTPALQTVKSFLALLLNLPTVQSGALRVLSPSSDYCLFGIEAAAFAVCLLPLARAGQRFPSAAALSMCVLLNLVFSPRAEEHSYPLAMTSLLLLLPELRRSSASAALVIIGTILLAWPFHLQERTPIIGTAAFGDFGRLWGGIALLVAATLSEYRRRHGSDVVTGDWTPAYAAGTLVLGLALYYAKPWRDPVQDGPLLAVSQSDGNTITLLRLDVEEREVSTIALECKGPFGLAFVQRASLYSACWNDSKISLINLARGSESQEIPSARLPAWIAYRDGKDEVWTSNEDRGTVSIFGASSAKLLAEVPTGKGASDIVFVEPESRAWISNEGDSTVSVLDSNSRRKIRDIQVGKVPQGMALAVKGSLLLVTNFGSNTVSLLDTSSLREIAQIPVCRGPVDVATASNRGSELGYVSCYSSGSLGVIDLEKKQMIQEIPVGDKPFGITARPRSGRVYVCVGGSNRLVVVDVNRPSRILRRIAIPGTPLQLALAPGTN